MDIVNLNVGLLGHVDSGKTSLAKTLSTISSTAAFDKNPQSQERGITIDLGFSSFSVDPPDHISGYSSLQYTLVDCPGHASLIKTIIGGVHIIDLILLVIDVTKGIQTQTAECLIIGEIMKKQMIVVLNKIDLLDENKQQSIVEKMTKKLKITLKNTIFVDSHIVPVSASKHLGIENLIQTLKQVSYVPERNTSLPFLFAIDHCFCIKGKGTVMTGTVLQGSVEINEEVEIPSIKLLKKIKSMQMFKKSINSAKQGDRVGICVTQFEPKLIERGLACKLNYVSSMLAIIIDFNKIQHYKTTITSKSKFHVSVGYSTVIGKIILFGCTPEINKSESIESLDFNKEFQYIDVVNEDTDNLQIFALIEFEKPVLVSPHSLVICSKLDLDIYANTCRLAFHGHVVFGTGDKNYVTNVLPSLKVFKNKQKSGFIERMVNENEVIGKNMFKKETHLDKFLNMKVQLETGETGIIESSFGQSGKFKLRLPDGLKETTLPQLSTKKKSTKTEENVNQNVIKVYLNHKRYLFDPQKRMIQ